MNWKHYAGMILLVALGYWLHAKWPGALSKVTGGIVAA